MAITHVTYDRRVAIRGSDNSSVNCRLPLQTMTAQSLEQLDPQVTESRCLDYACLSEMYRFYFEDDEDDDEDNDVEPLIPRRNEREEIRRKLALGSDSDDYYLGEKVTRKPSLSTRLQSGMNLQICFMNETASDHESAGSGDDHDDGQSSLPSLLQESSGKLSSKTADSLSSSLSSVVSNPSSETEPRPPTSSSSPQSSCSSSNGGPAVATKPQRPSFFFAKQRSWRLRSKQKHDQSSADETAKALKAAKEVEDFYTRQARLQAEARLALAQAKEMAKMQMQVEKQQKSKKSPIADIIGLQFTDNSYRISRQLLNNMNISQLQVVVNDLHSQIESLNEELVRLLMARDDLNMEQDSMLVDIEDLTRFLGANSENGSSQQQQQNGKTNVCLK